MNKIEYIKNGDYYMPNLTMEKEKIPTGKYALMRYNYLKQYHKAQLTILIINKQLNKHLQEVQDIATMRVESIVEELKKKNDLTEVIKNEDTIYWTGMMNNYKNQAEEIVLKELIYV